MNPKVKQRRRRKEGGWGQQDRFNPTLVGEIAFGLWNADAEFAAELAFGRDRDEVVLMSAQSQALDLP
jgi:hypothetical protein